MADAIPEIDIDLPEVSQLAFVVDDLEEAMERYRRILGIEPWKVYYIGPPEHEEGYYYDEAINPAFDIGYAYRGDLEIELIEPLEGPSIHEDFLADHGERVHHVGCFEFDDPYVVREKFENGGISMIQDGKWHDTHYMYFDTPEILDGLYFEILPGGDVDPGPKYIYPESA